MLMNAQSRGPSPKSSGFLNAAIVVLADAGQPLTVAEIVERALDRGLLQSSGKTPVASCRTAPNGRSRRPRRAWVTVSGFHSPTFRLLAVFLTLTSPCLTEPIA